MTVGPGRTRWSWPGQGGSVEEDESSDHDYWLSYSDLLAGLLMVFALMLLAALYHYQSGVEGVREILLIRENMAEQLEEQFEAAEGQIVEVDEYGTIRFKDRVLFSQGSAVVSERGRDMLAAFGQEYLGILLGNPRFRSQLESIVIEGHTNDDGPYFLNLHLSQERAYSVMEVLIRAAGEYEQELKRYVTANGRSFSEPIRTEEGIVDDVASRRIEIHFRLKDDEVIQEILDRISTDT